MNTFTPYDLNLAGNSLQKYDRVFDRVVNSCATMFERDLTDLIQSSVQVGATSIVEWKSLNEDSDALFFKSWASINSYKNAYCLIVIQKQLFRLVIEKIFGGKIDQSVAEIESRTPTSVEWRLYGRIANLLLSHMKEAMSSVSEFNIEMLRDAREASNAHRIHDKKNDHVASDVFHVHIDGTSGFIKIEYPTTLLKQAIESRTKDINEKSMLSQMKDSLSRVPMKLTADIAMNQITLESLLAMSEGDFLPFPDAAATTVSVAGKPMYDGKVMTQDDEQLAVLISGQASA